MKSLEEGEMGGVRDWRKALRSPPAYRIINRTLRSQTQFISVVAFFGLGLLLILYMLPKQLSHTSVPHTSYNYTYPLTTPIKTSSLHTYRLGIIADLDTNSKSNSEKNTWYSYYKKGYLSYSPSGKSVVVSWDRNEPIKLTTNFAHKGRGMELSELVVFDGRLLTFDDRSGMVFEIVNDKAIPWILLMDGDGKTTKGFKSEWATVKDEKLFVGSMGKEWTTPSGEFQSHNPQYVKVISTRGEITHLNWIEEYKRVRRILNIEWPGYMIHESGAWSDVHKRWFFLPRRCSKESYNETLDEHRGCSVLISADADLYDVRVIQIPNSLPARGFSSFKFVPSSEDTVIVALRTEELEGKTATYIMAFTIMGEILLDDSFVSGLKYEGLEFI